MEGDRGGILGLDALLRQRWDALEADFQQVYGIALAEAVWHETLTLRRFAVLVRGLPASARVWADTNGGWTPTDHLLADVWEALHAVRAAVVATVTTKPGHKLNFGTPASYPRPRPVAKPKRQKVSPVEFFEMVKGVSRG